MLIIKLKLNSQGCCIKQECVLFSLQLFDEDNPLHKSDNKYIFTTEGHVVPIDKRFREKQWSDMFPCEDGVLRESEPNHRPPLSNISNVSTTISHCRM